MKLVRKTFTLVLALISIAAVQGQTLSWERVRKLAPGTFVWVVTEETKACLFEGATEERLSCLRPQSDISEPRTGTDRELTFNRADVKSVQLVPRQQYWKFDDSRGGFDFMQGFYATAGVDARSEPDVNGGWRIGRLVTLDMSYDCFKGHCGFDAQNTAVLPLFRFPFYKPDKHQNFFKVFLEPGVGYHFGGDLHGYSSAGALVLLNSHWDRGVPYVEFTHRFPMGSSPWQGDNRIAVGIMMVVTLGSENH
jgi:hypothetical protein